MNQTKNDFKVQCDKFYESHCFFRVDSVACKLHYFTGDCPMALKNDVKKNKLKGGEQNEKSL